MKIPTRKRLIKKKVTLSSFGAEFQAGCTEAVCLLAMPSVKGSPGASKTEAAFTGLPSGRRESQLWFAEKQQHEEVKQLTQDRAELQRAQSSF